MIFWANTGRSFFESEAQPIDDSDKEFIDGLRQWVLKDLASELSPREWQLHSQPLGTWTQPDIVDGSWNTEAAQSILWALGMIEKMPRWDELANLELVHDEFKAMPNPMDWRPELILRNAESIDREGMIVETIYWRVRCKMDEKRKPGRYVLKLMDRANRLGHIALARDGDLLLPTGESFWRVKPEELQQIGSIVSERLRALNWLNGWDSDWDMVTADTIVSWLWDDKWSEGPSPSNPFSIASHWVKDRIIGDKEA